ncbi:RpiB/LacA/LacB family sugar-phosphate isomerase [Pelosinus propionicus]|uniref:Galactose-6-phosphate isomerase lacA subunit n=1 Tax=Pelosinus propionicus DSM 13327 TaxID=1123291 RepID=A0A1I4MLT4_9FIRM|nr:RpiB/LacA/LacB family sugar-phosphate isomerase [Pelosinus propionicus]SFM04043.1 galactose-6-phosphate isomerase lacA subunit [Pelosinus propionicus DSM 13327]
MMKIAIAANKKGKVLKEKVKAFLAERHYEMMDQSSSDIFEATMNIVEAIKNKTADKGIVIDEYGVAPFMISTKNHGIICAPVYDDYTSKMTRMHNATQIITLGSAISAEPFACQLALNFAESEYDGGRHQVRIDMLNKMV